MKKTPVQGPAIRNVMLATAMAAWCGCSSLQTVPVDEQSYLQYSYSQGWGGTGKATLRFKDAPRNMIEVLVEEQSQSRTETEFPNADEVYGEGNIETRDWAPEPRSSVIYPDRDNRIRVSRFFTRIGGLPLEIADFGPLWLPPLMLKSGKKLSLDWSGRKFKILDERTWKDRKVVALTSAEEDISRKGIWYYGQTTGLLAGFEGAATEQGQGTSLIDDSGEGAERLELVETNVEGMMKGGR